MYPVETCGKVAAYIICIGLALEFSHRVYWRLNERVLPECRSACCRTLFAAMVAGLPLATALIVTLVFAVLLDHLSLDSLGLRCNSGTTRHVAYGAGMALGCVTLAFLIGTLGGFIRVRRSRLNCECGMRVPLFVEALAAFFTSAVFEELIFRGYIYYLLQITWNDLTAVVGSSALFAVAHLFKHKGTPVMFTLNAFIFGLLAAICRQQTGSLWLPIGLHFGWNVVSGSILGLPYSGRTFERGVVVCDVSGPVWLTGGLYSLDAGALGTLALMIAAVGLVAVVPVH